MDPYLPIILTQNITLCAGCSYFVARNTVLTKREKAGFHCAFWLGIAIAVCELISTMAEGNPRLIWLQYLANVLHIGLTPLLPVLAILMFSSSRGAKLLAICPVLVNIFMLFFGQIFIIDPQGCYERGAEFWIFPANYLFNMILLTWRSFVFSASHNNHNIGGLLFISLFMISSTTIQMRHPQIHFSWFCVSVTILLYFIYYVDTMHKIDGLTGLLNRNVFEDDTLRLREKISGIVMIDLDDFKKINDTYGHQAGDRSLVAFSQCMLSAFQHSGSCYRMGGDEFCVLLNKTPSRLSPKVLTARLQEQCDALEGLPQSLRFSYGYEILQDNMTIEDAMKLADEKMYRAKAQRKKQFQNQI